jgi:hypothetical protein
MRLSRHAAQRLSERGIALEDVEAVCKRPEGDPLPGSSSGSLVIVGTVLAGRLKVVLSAADPNFVISAYWEV